MEVRRAKRIEARQAAAEIGEQLRPQPDYDHMLTLGPGLDLSDCEHGCNGDCVRIGSERCTFVCHPA